MNSKTTRCLVLLAAGLFAFIFFYERRLPNNEHRQALAAKLFPRFDPAKVTRVEVIRPGGNTLRVERTGRTWSLTVPLQYPAQDSPIESLLKAIGGLSRRAYIPATELLSRTNSLAEFGLDPPRARLIVQEGDHRLELSVGANTLLHHQAYYQLVGTDGVIVCDGALAEALPDSANAWRDATLLPLRGLDYDRLSVHSGNREFEVERDPATRVWRLTRPLPARADNLELNTILGELQEWQVNRFVTDNPAADLESFGLRPPEIELAFGQGTNDLLRVGFGKSPPDAPDMVYALQWSHTNVVLVSKALLQAFRDPLTVFRDHHLVAVDPNAVDLIVAHADEDFTVRRQPNGAWEVVKPATFPADPELVHAFLADLNQLAIVDFVKDAATSFDFANYGLTKPKRQYTLETLTTNAAAGATNRVLAQILFGNATADRVYVRRSDENSIYALHPGDDLPRAAFQLHERRVWTFTTNDLTAVTIRVKGQTRKWLHSPGHPWTAAGVPSNTPVPLALNETLYRLGRLQAGVWLAHGKDRLGQYGFAAADHQISIDLRRGGEVRTLTLRLSPFPSTSLPFATVTLEGEPYIFQLPLRVFEPYQELLLELNFLELTAKP
jgi:Domain of unknown function (DUF4340)